jgi:hypothetical protein
MSVTTKLVIAATLLTFGVLHLIGGSITEARLEKPVASLTALDGD